MKKQEKQKQKIKEVLLKILHIVSYVLSLAFIGLCILTGVQSCSNNKPNYKGNYRDIENTELRALANTYSDYKVYNLKYTEGTHNLPLGFENNLYPDHSDLFYPNLNINGSTVDLSFDYNAYVLKNEQLYKINGIRLFFRAQLSSSEQHYYLALGDYYFIYEGSGNYSKVIGKTSIDFDNRAYSFLYANEGFNQVYVFYDNLDSDQVIDLQAFNYFYEETEKATFTFNYQFNFNAPIGAMIDNSIYYIEDFNTTQYMPYVVKKINCLFVVNGELYNEMWFTYYRANDNIYYYDDFGRITLWEGTTYDSHGYFHDLKFVNSFNNVQVEVYRRRIYSQYEQGYSLIGKDGYWVSNYYQNIEILNSTSQLDLTLSKLNNTEMSTIGVSGGGYGDMFGLLTNAFASLLPILNISIIPGITLGLLLFIPLIVILISVVVRLIKK